ncbi:outer membrane beta-barrel protein [Cytophagaceae bacterium ABcell3]|nr:outer membrane beta-barrel protein [Cytophagaceae bacterium ABcell3]
MKFFFWTVLAFAFVSNTLYAQNNALGIKNSIVFSLPQEPESSTHLGFGTSLTYRRALSEKVGLSIEPGFLNTGVNFIYNISGEQINDGYTFRYLEMPVLFSYLLASESHFFDFHTGFSPMLLLRAHYERLDVDVSQQVKRHTLNYLIGASFKYKQERVDWGLTARYGWNLNRTYQEMDYRINLLVFSASVAFWL